MRIIAHVDMDAFFASVEERDNPRFRGAPLVVGADPKGGKGRGVVSTASYAARKYGIRSAMPISVAWRLSEKAALQDQPPAVFLPVNMHRYAEVSGRIMEILGRHAAAVEQASIDEAYLDLSHLGSFPKASRAAVKIKWEIRKQEEVTASIGIGPNKLVAKIASGTRKPDGLTVVRPKEVRSFLDPLSIRELPGIGPKTEQILNGKDIFTVQDLRQIPRADLVERFGKWGIALYERSRGVDESPLETEYEAKSVGEQETFDEDTRDSRILNERLRAMAESIVRAMRLDGFTAYRTVVLTVRFSDFETKSRSRTLKESSGEARILQREILKLFLPFLDRRENPGRKAFRLLGVRVEKLT